MFGRTKVAMVVAEFVGAALLTLGILSAGKSGVGFSIFIAATVGVIFAGAILFMNNQSEGHYNPAVTLGLWTARKITTLNAVVYIAAQFLGAYVASLLYVYMGGQQLQNVAGKSFEWRVFVAEMVGTLVLSLGIAAAVYRGARGRRWATIAGLALFAGVVVAAIGSNGIVNPAIALGVKSWSKAYVIAPLVGGILGVNLYSLLFANTPELLASETVVVAEAVAVSGPARRTSTARKSTAKPARKTSTRRGAARGRR